MDWQALSVLAKQAWRNRARMEVRIWRRKAIWLGSGAVKLQRPHTFCCPSPRARPHCPTSRTAARSRCGAVLSLFVTAFGVAPRAHRAAARICRSRRALASTQASVEVEWVHPGKGVREPAGGVDQRETGGSAESLRHRRSGAHQSGALQGSISCQNLG
jgi:hypothetical protein